MNSSHEVSAQVGEINAADPIDRMRGKKVARSPNARRTEAVLQDQGVIRSVGQSGGTSIAGKVGTVAGDMVGGNKFVVTLQTFVHGIDAEITAKILETQDGVTQVLEAIKGNVTSLRSADERLKLEVAQRGAERRFNEGRPEDASRVFMEVLEREDQAEQQRREDHRRFRVRLLEEAIVYDKKASQADAAFMKLRLVAETVWPADSKTQERYLAERATEYQEHGKLKGDYGALLVAVSILQGLRRDFF